MIPYRDQVAFIPGKQDWFNIQEKISQYNSPLQQIKGGKTKHNHLSRLYSEHVETY